MKTKEEALKVTSEQQKPEKVHKNKDILYLCYDCVTNGNPPMIRAIFSQTGV
jgi:hypothetical protein